VRIDKRLIENRARDFSSLVLRTEVHYRGSRLSLESGARIALEKMREAKKSGDAFFFIGNGGSAAICSHMIPDFIKSCDIKAFNFLDPSLLTCMLNDYGDARCFSEPLQKLMAPEDILVAISSSGSSRNIIKAVSVAKDKGCCVITFSGFSKNNRLRTLGDLNFYVPSSSYRFVESVHEFILHHFFVDFFVLAEEENK